MRVAETSPSPRRGTTVVRPAIGYTLLVGAEASMARLTKGDILARRAAIARVARAHGAADIRLFGSLARDEADEASDVDFLVTPAAVTPPFFPGGLVAALEDLLGVTVQVTLDSPRLSGPVRAAIDRDLVAL